MSFRTRPDRPTAEDEADDADDDDNAAAGNARLCGALPLNEGLAPGLGQEAGAGLWAMGGAWHQLTLRGRFFCAEDDSTAQVSEERAAAEAESPPDLAPTPAPLPAPLPAPAFPKSPERSDAPTWRSLSAAASSAAVTE